MRIVLSGLFFCLLPYIMIAQKKPANGEWTKMKWSELDTNVLYFISIGAYEKAIPYAEQMSLKAQKSLGKQSTGYLQTLYYLAEIYQGLLDYDETIDFYIKIENLLPRIFQNPKDQEPSEILVIKQIELWAKLANLYKLAGNDAKAEAMNKEIDKKIETVKGDSTGYSEIAFELGKMAEEKGHFFKAEAYYIDSRLYNTDRETAIYINDALMCLYPKMGESVGEELLEEESFYKLQRYMRFIPGSNLPDFVARYEHKGKYLHAETLYIIARQSVEPFHKSINNIKLLENLVRTYIEMGEYTGAKLLLQEASRSYSDLYGWVSDEHASIAEKMAKLYLIRGDYMRANRLYGEAIDKAKSSRMKYNLTQKMQEAKEESKRR